MRGSAAFEVSSSNAIVYVIGLGANLGEPLLTLRAATGRIAALPKVKVLGRSRVYRSAPMGPPQPDFLNAAIKLEIPSAPMELLERLHQIEADFGRVREERWGPRTLDLDLLWSSIPINVPELTIPHPALHQRWWALRPLLDVAPELTRTYGPVLTNLLSNQGSSHAGLSATSLTHL